VKSEEFCDILVFLSYYIFMAKTILAIFDKASDVKLVRQVLANEHRVWNCPNIARALELMTEGLKPQMVLSPFIVGETEALFEHKDLQISPIILYAEPKDIAKYQHQMRRARAIMHYPINEFVLLRDVERYIRIKDYPAFPK
jgi:DNA-binding NtrC family response regulator